MIELELDIQEPAWNELSDIKSLVLTALQAGESISGKAGTVSVRLTNNLDMQRLNKQFRGKDTPTDVLSFPADSMDAPFLGDIAVGYEICAKDADSSGKALADHLSHLIIHGYLHLLGFDHIEDAEAEEMEMLERRALASIGIADPYSAP